MASHGLDAPRPVLTLAALLSWLVAWCGVGLGDVAEGDLLFLSPLRGNAITAVTAGPGGLSVDHVAIAHRIGGAGGPLYVVEAVGRGVTLTPVDSLLVRDGVGQVSVGRVLGIDGPRSVRRALGYVGRPYDWFFEPGDSAVYCSELVLLSLVDACGNPLLAPVPMTFRDASGEIPAFWTGHYGKRGLPVPEGAPGSNPSELSRRREVEIIGVLEVPVADGCGSRTTR